MGGDEVTGVEPPWMELVERSLAASACEDRAERRPSLCDPGCGLPSDAKAPGTLLWDFSTSRRVRREFLVCRLMATGLGHFRYSSSNRVRQIGGVGANHGKETKNLK